MNCQKCKKYSTELNIIGATTPKFSENYGEGGYHWKETIQCDCGEIYTIDNGT